MAGTAVIAGGNYKVLFSGVKLVSGADSVNFDGNNAGNNLNKTHEHF